MLEDCFGELGCLSRWADRTAWPCQNLSHSLEDSHQRAAVLRATPCSKKICKFFCSAFHNRLAGREEGELVEERRGTSGPMKVLYLLFLWGKTLRPGLEPYSRVTCMVSIAPYPKDPQSQHPKREAWGPWLSSLHGFPIIHIERCDHISHVFNILFYSSI